VYVLKLSVKALQLSLLVQVNSTPEFGW